MPGPADRAARTEVRRTAEWANRTAKRLIWSTPRGPLWDERKSATKASRMCGKRFLKGLVLEISTL